MIASPFDSGPPHVSVLLSEVIDALDLKAGGIYVDGTFGAGGYTRAMLAAADCTVCAIDRDPVALGIGEALAREAGGRLRLLKGCFSQMDQLVRAAGFDAVDGVALDIGVSSMQIDDAARGFSFRNDGPLDMRMGDVGETAADLVNSLDEVALADLIWRYGDEPNSRRIARAIVAARTEAPITRTGVLAAVIEKAAGARAHRGKAEKHPATRTFQALRIRVNDELGELERGLQAAESLLRPGGRLVVVSFHSLEDRMVKEFLIERAGAERESSRHLPPAQKSGPAPTFQLVKRGAVKPTAEEERANPRARSARLRTGIRTAAPAWSTLKGVAA